MGLFKIFTDSMHGIELVTASLELLFATGKIHYYSYSVRKHQGMLLVLRLTLKVRLQATLEFTCFLLGLCTTVAQQRCVH